MLTPAANYKDAGIILSANCGARLGEVCAAKVSEIDFVNGTFRIERAVQRIKQGEKTQLVVQTPKSESSVRTVPLPADALEYLQKGSRRSAAGCLYLDRSNGQTDGAAHLSILLRVCPTPVLHPETQLSHTPSHLRDALH